ncbi:MAG: prepilin-type N-terminal cleavage/methylation domain-containing protein [Gemmatimonadetes bacterium]|uniref:Type II secretion system protein H n=1 Tax=Candidatus Kutchimonas denitrificans TaxID=3056748 RepID=A0AAE4Z9U4_9BACT|nr:prepilin-type N-terminal cleavage/methylation domain-containing protein [Gemmatimonadota bacterium]NIR75327.1 prepilin-type N-terminal cleavage/methylation domain-containing protein [Candidatus Kutchimonas denitrificans]NIS02153.1 prepilin-type N-terminal cleavage/methylation domain-containing protein [Gemmatimonadota bacterium]NIT67978.1 prepilin-type N-terminal cleavage/methylation domain-containing protein [Gemmatimonadota bacterium]NIU53972.1 prepilin-type N-terminal cleavage/methylation
MSRRGFSLIEMVVVLVLLGVVAGFAIPRALKKSPRSQVDTAARALARDLELVRMRAIAAKRIVRMTFVQAENGYTAFLDVSEDRSGVITGSREEVTASRLLSRGKVNGVPGVELPNGVVFGAGAATSGPEGLPADGAVTLEGDRVEFDAGGMVRPAGTGGAIYLVHEGDPKVVAAVTVSGAGAFRAWQYVEGEWVDAK